MVANMGGCRAGLTAAFALSQRELVECPSDAS